MSFRDALDDFRDRPRSQQGSGGGGFPISRLIKLVVAILVLVFVWVGLHRLVYNVKANEIVVQQDPVSGHLHVWNDPGMHNQWFGSAEAYSKSGQFWFSVKEDQGGKKDESIEIRFNDGGTAHISGSLRFDLPLEVDPMIDLHTRFHGQMAIERELIRTVVEKAIYMTGPLMSSKESYAERRNEMLALIDDQIQHGIFATQTQETRVEDPLTGQIKTQLITKRIQKPDGSFLREDESPLQRFHIKTYGLSINHVEYHGKVEEQIQEQQKLTMQVQTSLATARQAEQQAITAEAEGKAAAAKAKWTQEAIKAQKVTEAEQEKAVATTQAEKERDVAALQEDAAKHTKAQQILLGEGEAERRKLVMAADGALEKKLATIERIQLAWADAVSKQRQVPEIVMGGSGVSDTGNAAAGMMNTLWAAQLKQLELDMNLPGGKSGGSK